MRAFLGALEYVLRLLFFAWAPILILVLGRLVPMTAALVNMALALTAFFFAEVLRRWAEQKGWLGRVLRRQLAFEAYYRERPPKPFLYYLFYPLLFPYWLAVRDARREFWLFKGYTVLTLALVIISGVYRLVFVYRPELGLRDFVVPFTTGLVVETFAVMMLIMPITTSVVALHMRAQHARLVVLIVVGLASASFAAWRMAHEHRTRPSMEARYRVEARTRARPADAQRAMIEALRSAWASKGAGTREKDGILEGPPLETARAALGTFYREDEAASFDVWLGGRSEKKPMIVIVAEGRTKKSPPVFLGMRPDGSLVRKGSELPSGARKIVRDTGPL